MVAGGEDAVKSWEEDEARHDEGWPHLWVPREDNPYQESQAGDAEERVQENLEGGDPWLLGDQHGG